MPKRITYNEYIDRLIEKYGNLIDFSKIDKESFSFSKKYTYRCTKHNIEFVNSCKCMCKGTYVCPECYKEYKSKTTSLRKPRKQKTFYSLNDFKILIKDKFKDKISIIESTLSFNGDNKILMKRKCECVCKKHGKFITSPRQILRTKHGCPKCARESSSQIFIQRGEENRNDFIELAKQVHGNRYDYSKVDTTGKLKKIKIKCYKHGYFYQMPSAHLKGEGCPMCGKLINGGISTSELRLLELLKIKFPNLIWESQYRENLGRQSIDIFNRKYKIGIEYQGKQHFESSSFFEDERHNLIHTNELDKKKFNKCLELGIKLFYFNFDKSFKHIDYLSTVYVDLNDLYNDIEKYIQKYENISELQ